MSFDKVKAMRNAERFLSQGKIRAAISEYKHIIESDPTDYNTLNMLGDMYIKATEETEAVNCFTQVAEHYSKQGFSQKAIAIYNKISRLKPDSLEVSSKLAHLYQQKGSVAEARTHYTTMADQYTRLGKKAEALMVWKQIANLDPNNTEIYLKIADACWQDNQKSEAAQAYVEAGNRLVLKKQYESAVTAFARCLEINPDDLVAMKGFVDSQIQLGYVEEAVKSLEEALIKQPYHRELIMLLVDCHFEMDNVKEAERLTIKLVEQEPSNFPKLLDLVKVYLRNSELLSAVRPLTMASEHLLVGGQAELLESYINQILNKDPEQLEALRLLVRLHTWQRDEIQIKSALERLAEAARMNDAVDDEKNALSQLIMISPQSSYFAQRLHELNSGEPYSAPINYGEVPTFESFSNLGDEDSFQTETVFANYDSGIANTNSNGNGNGNGHSTQTLTLTDETTSFSSGFKFADEIDETETFAEAVSIFEPENLTVAEQFQNLESVAEPNNTRELNEFERDNLQKEIEGIDFYVAQGFTDLAEKALVDIEEKFGHQPEIEQARNSLNVDKPELASNQEIQPETFTAPIPEVQESALVENNQVELVNDFEQLAEVKSEMTQSSDNLLNDIKSEFGIAEEIVDFDTPYQTGTAYKEMGLIEESIREFQNAVKLTSPEDGTRRFYWCCNLLGQCFMEKQMPSIALIWLNRGLEVKNLTNEELQGLHYEIANAYEQGGDTQKAVQHYEQIYAFNVSFRDVAERLAKVKSR